MSRESKIGHYKVISSQDYIFVLYSDRKFDELFKSTFICKDILVFDWEGNPVKRYIPDKGIRCMAYDKSSNSLIGVGLEDDYVFYQYKMSGLGGA